jgi:hypothetical protein
MMSKLSIKYRALDDLIPYEQNAREHSEGQVRDIARSIDRFGFTAPILIDEQREIIAGHGRLEAAKLREMTEVPTITLSGLSEEERRAYRIADNKLTIDGDWNVAILEQELRSLKDIGFEIDLTGFSEPDLDKLSMSLKSDDEAPPRDLVYSDETVAAEAFDYFRAEGFPWPKMALHEAMQEVNALSMQDDEQLARTSTANRVADTYHPHRLTYTVQGKKSPVEAFESDKLFRRALAWQLEHGRLARSIFPCLVIVSGVQQCANFRPGFALLMYRLRAPGGARILDTSTGFGGRLVGFAALNDVRATYVGIDPNTRTHEGNVELASDLRIAERVRLINQPAEDVDADDIGADSFDFAFTSPPYFTKEHYGDEETQSWRRYPEPQRWRDEFLRKMLALQFAALKSGAFSCINIAPVKIGKIKHPVDAWTIDDARAIGFDYITTERFELPSMPGANLEERENFEPVIVLKKP